MKMEATDSSKLCFENNLQNFFPLRESNSSVIIFGLERSSLTQMTTTTFLYNGEIVAVLQAEGRPYDVPVVRCAYWRREGGAEGGWDTTAVEFI